VDRTLADARLPDGTVSDIALIDGRIAALGQGCGAGLPRVELGGRMVWPGFVDVHTHLDKGHVWPRAENPDGSFSAALAAVAADRRAHWTAGDVRRRFEFGLRCAYAHGTVAIRTHIDSLDPQYRISWPVFSALRDEWRGRIALQGVAIVGVALLDDAAYATALAACLREHGGIMGGVIHPMDFLERRIENLVRLCIDHELRLYVHIDETLDPAANSLPVLAEALLRMGYPYPVTVGHCCSLATQDADQVERTLRKMRRARIQVVSLPMCNLYLQDRGHGRTPRLRGVTLLHELAAAGIEVALASDNCRDPFYAYGDHDMLEVFREATRIAHLDRPHGDWHRAVTATPADIMGLRAGRIEPGAVADLVIFKARSMNELLSRPQSDRTVLRAGVAIDTTLPDYAELDDLFAAC
jgi:cytosine deaminase